MKPILIHSFLKLFETVRLSSSSMGQTISTYTTPQLWCTRFALYGGALVGRSVICMKRLETVRRDESRRRLTY